MKDYIKCERIGEGTLTFKHFFYILAVHYTHQYMICIVVVHCSQVHHVVHYNHQNMHYILLCGLHYSFLQRLGNIVHRRTLQQIFGEDLLPPPMNMVTVD